MIHCDRCDRDFPTTHGFKTHCGIKHKDDLVCRVFAGNKTQQYRQIGNAVCPPVARAIWQAIKKVRMSLW